MTETCRRILEEYQVRKSTKQKLRFIEFLQSRYPKLRLEEGGWPRCRNLILGDPDSAQVILTAHYDTCARLPFPNFITPKNLLITLAYSLVITLPFFVIPFFLEFLAVRYLPGDLWWSPLVALALGLFLVYYVFIGGPANPHTVNDNTSGLIFFRSIFLSSGPRPPSCSLTTRNPGSLAPPASPGSTPRA